MTVIASRRDGANAIRVRDTRYVRILKEPRLRGVSKNKDCSLPAVLNPPGRTTLDPVQPFTARSRCKAFRLYA
jgi:hypothetical protein